MTTETRTVTVHCTEMPDTHRACAVELRATGEWLVANYNARADLWALSWGVPVETLAGDEVAQWAYLDEVFAPGRWQKS